MESTTNSAHDFSAISPSAKALLLLKGNTGIPFMRQAAELVQRPEPYVPGYEDKSLLDCLRIMHFEARYISIDRLLEDVPAKNILELSSGLSFRGLATVQHKDVYYMDTDLPGVIAEKIGLLDQLQQGQQDTIGKLELLALNALDEVQFAERVGRFPKGQIAIVNEGLLMYLDMAEKEKLCAIIHKTLQERGGCWITADIYVKNPLFQTTVKTTDQLQSFFDQHKVEENKFDSFEAAKAFFRKCGFVIEKEMDMDYASLTALPFVMKKATDEQLMKMGNSGRMNATWRLRVA